MVKLSQCMIVKNEESNIEKALSWAKDIAYEQIVVDTGSTDRTVEIAKAMGAKVYDFEWIDDFSAAKNYAISKATGDWIAFLDADEYFNEEDAKRLMYYIRKLKNTKYIAILASWLQLNDEGRIFGNDTQIRIFRNMKGLKYCNPIHEYLTLNGESVIPFLVDASNELSIFHTGYMKRVSVDKKKSERNIQALLREIEKDPENRDLMGYLGDSYLLDHNYEEARKWFERAIDSLDMPIGRYGIRTSISFTYLMRTLCWQKEFKRFLEVYEQAINVIPEEPDFDYLMSFYWIDEKKDFERGLFYLEQAFEKLEIYKGNFYGSTFKGELEKAWELRTICYYNLQNWSKCLENCVVLLKQDAYRYTTTTMLLNVFQMDEAKGGASAGAVLQFLANLYSLQNLKDRMYLLKAATDIQYEGMIQELRKLFTPEELAALDSCIES